MAPARYLAALLCLGFACGESPPAASPAMQPSHEPPAVSSSAPPAQTAATVYVSWHTAQTIDGLEVYVSSLEVKEGSDGREVLKGSLRLRAGGQEKELAFSDPASLDWNGYRIEVRGGSKEAVGIAVSRAK